MNQKGYETKKFIQINVAVEQVLERSDKMNRNNYQGHLFFLMIQSYS